MPVVSRRRAAAGVLAGALAIALAGAAAAGSAGAVSSSGTDSRPLPARLFAADSFWYRQLPASAPLDPNSPAIIRDLWKAGEQQYGAPGKPNIAINTHSYTPTVHVATNADPVVSFKWDNCQGLWSDNGLYATQLAAVHLPVDARPAQGSDGEMVVYNRDTDTYTELWRARKDASGQWWSCWGGTRSNASSWDGIWTGGFGTTATGLPFLGGLLRADELAKGEINHVVGLAVPFAAWAPATSWPAQRSDGQNGPGFQVLRQGQMVRLPATLDLDAMKLSPSARAVAKAVQKYGAVIWDTAGAITFRAENPQALRSDPFDAIYRYRDEWSEMQGDPAKGEVPFPLDKLQVLAAGYRAPLPTAPSPIPSPTTPTSAPTISPSPTPSPTPNPTPKAKKRRTAVQPAQRTDVRITPKVRLWRGW